MKCRWTWKLLMVFQYCDHWEPKLKIERQKMIFERSWERKMNLQLSNAFWHIYFHFNQWLYKTNRKVCKYGIIQKRKVQGIIRSSNGPFSKSLDFACRRMKWGLCIENTPFYLRYFKALNSLYCLHNLHFIQFCEIFTLCIYMIFLIILYMRHFSTTLVTYFPAW